MKISEIRRMLLSQAYKATSLATKARLAKNTVDHDQWATIAKLNRDYVSYIDYISSNQLYFRSNQELIAQKLYWVLSHIDKCDIIINENKKDKKK